MARHATRGDAPVRTRNARLAALAMTAVLAALSVSMASVRSWVFSWVVTSKGPSPVATIGAL